MTEIKICGLKTPESVTAAIEGGADYIGFVFHPSSPRYIDVEIAAYLAGYIPERVKICALFVDPDDTLLSAVLSSMRTDIIQLHGSETPARAKDIKNKFRTQVMKALPVSDADDLLEVHRYADACDWILLDAKTDGIGFGGSGETIDWRLLQGFSSSVPWMLAGGLTAGNVSDALTQTAPNAVDVSSGIESTRGVKDPVKIREFIEAVRAHDRNIKA